MKRIVFILSLCFCLNGRAQYTKLIDFGGTTNGSYPVGDLMQASDGMLYGMTNVGGASTNCTGGCGVLFQYNLATSIYTKKIDFTGTTNGSSPYGSLIQASNGMLYGMTQTGGTNTNGVLFQYNPTTNAYTKELDFAGTINGEYPQGNLMQASDGMLYGMTYQGGANGYGVLFQYNPTTNTLINKLDFTIATIGGNPRGSLMQASDGMLYGMTQKGGAYNAGVLFQYNPATSTYTKKIDFNSTNGYQPYGSLMQASDGMLYGMTYQGGANHDGILFQYNSTTNILIDKLDFIGVSNGQYPSGSFMQASDGMLYGMTAGGGVNGYGVLFKYGIGAAGIKQVANSNEVSIYPNPASSSLQITFSGNIQNTTIEIYNTIGECVHRQITTSSNCQINVADLAEGIYNVSISSNEGVVNKRLVIVK